MCISLSTLRAKCSVLLVLLVFLAGTLDSVRAQTNPSNSLDDIYSPPAGSILSSGGSNAIKEKSSSRSGEDPGKSFISWDVGMGFRGVLALSYGYTFRSRFGLEAGLGASLLGDYIANYSNKIYLGANGEEPYYSESNVANFQYFNSYPEIAFRPYFHLKALYFLNQDPMEGAYLSLQYRNYQNSLVYGGDFAENNMLDEEIPRYNISYRSLNFAVGFRKPGNALSVHDYCIGLGFRMGRFPKIPITQWNSNVQEPEDQTFDNVLFMGKPSSEYLSINRMVLVASYIWHFNF